MIPFTDFKIHRTIMWIGYRYIDVEKEKQIWTRRKLLNDAFLGERSKIG